MMKTIYKLKSLSRSELMIKGFCLFTLLIYLYCVLSITLIDRNVGMRRHMLEPFWEYRSMLRTEDYVYWAEQILGNIVMLFPLGLLLPILFDRFKDIRFAALAGFAASFCIESAQYLTGRGLFELDDIMHNTMGACAGCLFYTLICCRRSENE